ncbi:uncharacterized protein LOC122505801, partial [Leptopilina heterotoma]|uniref:uncharacterized protein LOC122505801 n=1 Tax=Leptopilina heterotoma TaxID=63436 RepID=UPI001CA90630
MALNIESNIVGQEIIVRLEIIGTVSHENRSVSTNVSNISRSNELPQSEHENVEANDLNFNVPSTFLTDYKKEDNQLRLNKGYCRTQGCSSRYTFTIYSDIEEGSPITVHVQKTEDPKCNKVAAEIKKVDEKIETDTNFFYSLNLYSKRQSRFIDTIDVDFNTTLIECLLQVFNSMTLTEYLELILFCSYSETSVQYNNALRKIKDMSLSQDDFPKSNISECCQQNLQCQNFSQNTINKSKCEKSLNLKSEDYDKNPNLFLDQLAKNHFQNIANAINAKSIHTERTNTKNRKYMEKDIKSCKDEDEEQLHNLSEKKLNLATEVWMDKKKKNTVNTYFKSPKYISQAKKINENSKKVESVVDLLSNVKLISGNLKNGDLLVEDSMENARKRSNCDKPILLETPRPTIAFSKPWSGHKFPKVWDKKEVFVSGIKVDDRSFRTLKIHECLDDAVIDSFIAICASKFTDINLLNFSVYNVLGIINENYKPEFCLNWCQNIRAKNYDAWLLPVHDSEVHNTGHWTLFLVVFSQKYIIYFDSLKGDPVEKWVSKLCALINQTFCHKPEIFTDWAQWTLIAPKDVPSQGHVRGSSNNCGAHLCTWAWTLYSGQEINFTEYDMNKVRPWIQHEIETSQTKNEQRQRQRCKVLSEKNLQVQD